MFLICYLFQRLNGTLYFRVAWGIEALPAVVVLCLSSWFPESPKYLISHKKWKEAYNVLTMFKNPDDTLADAEAGNAFAGDVERAIDEYSKTFEKEKRCSFFDLFRKPLLKHTLLGLCIQVLFQLTAINVLMYFLVYICEMIGLREDAKTIATAAQYVINIVFTIIPVVLLDKMRRIDILGSGFFLIGICLIVISYVMGMYGHSIPPLQGNPAIQWEIKGKSGSIVLALCYGFVAIFASTIACGAWVYTEEIFPNYAKSRGCSVCISTSWLLTAALTFVGPLMLQYLKWATFLIFGVICLGASFGIGLWCPETLKKTDDEVKRFFYEEEEVEKAEKSEKGEELYDISNTDLDNVPRLNEIRPFPNSKSFSVEGASTSRAASTSTNYRSNKAIPGKASPAQISPFFQESETNSLFNHSIKFLSPVIGESSPFDNIEDRDSSFKINLRY